MIIFRFTTAALLLGLLTSIGCSGGAKLAEVEGTVKLKGKPLEKIQVEFWPLGKGQRSTAVTDDQGRYTLMTDDGKQKGATVGTHKVILRDTSVLGNQLLGRAGADVDMAKGKKSRIGEEYADPQKTPLQKEVTAGKSTIDLDL